MNRSEGEEPPSSTVGSPGTSGPSGSKPAETAPRPVPETEPSEEHERACRNGGRNGKGEEPGALKRAVGWIMGRLRGRNGDSQQLRETLEEIIGEIEDQDDEDATPIGTHERMLLGNIFKLRHLTAYDVMVPRADIVALPLDADFDRVLETIAEGGHSRLPVFRESLDDIVGMVHIKDVLAVSRQGNAFRLGNILRPAEFVAPSMRVLDLLLDMRLKRSHLALVVDEFGGIDGLVTAEDLVEEIVGEIEDEHDVVEAPKMAWRPDGTLLADARTPIEDFEKLVGPILTEEEHDEDIDTLGGLVFYIAGRIPGRGELVEHASGVTFEVLQADPRRIKRLRLRNLPALREAGAG
ncbi:hemolysin family protein [Aquibaculum arenosum]|uniref:Hemolysin family protein n=1 Tax=Aquibaculum arenosum TaxID=3032591 RepID=A0ABT5YKL6_9PROT|nr:hemolysin family protein [Fodinicurvata sp. CAU 1616]